MGGARQAGGRNRKAPRTAPHVGPWGQSETNVTTEPSTVEWIADADLTRASFYWDWFHIAEIRPVRAKFAAKQFHARIAPNNAMTLSRIDWL